MKKLVRLIHLWLGFTSGLVVFIVALTGAIWAFESEISDLVYPYRKVKVQNKPVLSISEINKIASLHLKKINSVSYLGPDRSIEVRDWTRTNGNLVNNYVYINPYTGEILAVLKNQPTFFEVVVQLHTNLLLGDAGAEIVRFATLIFLILMISGIYLWWPRRKQGLKQRLIFDWKKTFKWKRKNYDLHSILGFYASLVIIFVVVTGLAWTFSWVDRSVYGIATLGETYKDYPEVNSVTSPGISVMQQVDDYVLDHALKHYKEPVESWRYYFPQDKEESVTVYLNPDSKTFYKASAYYYDQRSGQLLLNDDPEKVNNGQYVRNMYYDIHIGKVLGLPGQLMVFFASLIVASLPITGFYIWYGRKYKKVGAIRN